MRQTLLAGALMVATMALNAQTSYKITNSVTLKNQDTDLTKTIIILPVAQSNNYQDVSNLSYSSGEVLSIKGSSNKYLRDLKVSDLPAQGDSYSLTENFHITLYPMYIDMSQFKTLYPYDTESDLYKRYTSDRGEYIDTRNVRIQEISNTLWSESKGNVLDYTRLCYEHVGANYKYLNPNTGIHKMVDILSAKGGDCGNLASVFVNLLRAKKIPSRHIVTVRPDGSFHVWADFYLERYGWIPVDANMKLDHPEGNYFGYCRGDGIVMSEDLCNEVEPQPGQTFNGVILQNFFYWYDCKAGRNVQPTHQVKGELIPSHVNPTLSKIGSSKATLHWQKVNGATGYRINVYKKGDHTLVKTTDVKATQTAFILKGMKKETEYTVELIPLREVENIETQMNAYTVHLKTV